MSLPFPPDDAIYGYLPGSGAHGVPAVGSWNIRGEEGTVVFPLGSLARLRANPFWPIVSAQLESVVAADTAMK